MRLIEKQKQSMSLEHYEGDTGTGTVAEAAELLYDILNASYACSGTCLSVEVNGQTQTVQSLYWTCKELMSHTGRCFEKTGFLSMSVLEQTWQAAKPMCLLPLDGLMSENGDLIVKKAHRLEEIFATNPYKAIWEEKSGQYTDVLRKLGFTTANLDFSDLTSIMDPLLSALSFYDFSENRYAPSISKIRNGSPSKLASPAIATAICRYHSEKEFVDAVMDSGKEAMLAFGAIEKTNRQMKDYFYEYMYGFPEERQRNFMRNDHLTTEEYLDAPCEYTRKVLLAVKDGGTLYLVHMPFKGDTYQHPGSKDSEYAYGRRTSYAPYQVFCAEGPIAPEGSTMLAIKKDGWLLSDIMDPPAKAWLPAFLEETVNYFFRDRDAVRYKAKFLPEETTAETKDEEGNACSIVPVWSGLPTKVSYTYRIPAPESLFAIENSKEYPNKDIYTPYDASTGEKEANAVALWFIEYFAISSKDVAGAPILPKDMGTNEEYAKHMDGQVKRAYVKVICDRLCGVTQGRWDARRWAIHKTMDRESYIVQKALDGAFDDFADVEIAGEPLFKKDGTPETEWNRRAGRYIQKTSSIPIEDTREDTNLFRTMGHRILWASQATSSKPAVVMQIRPRTPEQYAKMFGMPEDTLPEILRLCEKADVFVKHFSPWIPNHLTNKWNALGYGDQAEKCVIIPCIASVNVCMNKKTWAAARPQKKKEEKNVTDKDTAVSGSHA